MPKKAGASRWFVSQGVQCASQFLSDAHPPCWGRVRQPHTDHPRSASATGALGVSQSTVTALVKLYLQALGNAVGFSDPDDFRMAGNSEIRNIVAGSWRFTIESQIPHLFDRHTRKAGSLRRLLASRTLAFGKESPSDADLPVDSLFRFCNKQIKTLNLLTSVL